MNSRAWKLQFSSRRRAQGFSAPLLVCTAVYTAVVAAFLAVALVRSKGESPRCLIGNALGCWASHERSMASDAFVGSVLPWAVRTTLPMTAGIRRQPPEKLQDDGILSKVSRKSGTVKLHDHPLTAGEIEGRTRVPATFGCEALMGFAARAHVWDLPRGRRSFQPHERVNNRNRHPSPNGRRFQIRKAA
jgi:hypothetical protein